MNEEQFNQLTAELQILREENSRLQALQAATQDPLVPAIVPAQVSTQFPAHVTAAKIALPERFDGDRSQFREFINQCRLLFFTHPDHYPSKTNKVGLIMSLLTGNALRLASPYIEKGSPVLQDYELFMKEFSKVFDDPQRTQTADDAIRALRQSSTTVSMYASEFKRLMMDIDWNESALVSQFSEGLNENILDTLALFQTPLDLEEYINAAITFDTRLTRRKEEKSRRHASTVSMKSEPMSKSTPKQSSKPVYNHPNSFMIPVTIHTPGNHSFKIMAMIDSGAFKMFINKKIVDAKCIRTQAKKDPISVGFIDGSPLTEGPITHHTKPLKIQIQDNHRKLAVYNVMTCYHADMILGLPWLNSRLLYLEMCSKSKERSQRPIVELPPGQQSYQLMGLPIVNISQEIQNRSQDNQSRGKHSQENYSQEIQAIDKLQPHQEVILNDFHFDPTVNFGLESIIDSNHLSGTSPCSEMIMESQSSTSDSSNASEYLDIAMDKAPPIPTMIRPKTPPPADPVETIRKRSSDTIINEPYTNKKKKLTVSHMIGLISQA
ncbi:Retrotransposon-derived protein PEG10 [Smittium culicis]|uniref:Retrotransposon-derived protein PEG10 n=1 Tax=Smittium culicis TaxID=133412 RepID=A0A1R1XC84_9FUNG|nr:Retrotransposon-derived protein PEG10 [Smittium culicis]